MNAPIITAPIAATTNPLVCIHGMPVEGKPVLSVSTSCGPKPAARPINTSTIPVARRAFTPQLYRASGQADVMVGAEDGNPKTARTPTA